MRRKYTRRKTVSLGVLRLEDRTLPASTITVTVGANGSGSLDSFLFDGTPGIITTADGGANPGTLSTGALAAVSSTRDISVSSSSNLSVNDLGGTLTLQPGAGRGVTFNSVNGSVRFANQANTLATKGASLHLLGGSDVIACNLNSAGGNVDLIAVSGNLVARTIQTGGAGNITVQASLGSAGSGTVIQTGSAVGQAMLISAAGSVTTDVLQGTSVSISSTGGRISSNSVQSTAQLTLSAATGIQVNSAQAASIQATNSTSGGISITQAATPALALTTAGTGIRNLAAGGGLAITNLGDAITVAASAPVQTVNGAIILAALNFSLLGTVNSGTARTTLANSTAGRPISLGQSPDLPASILLGQAELNNVTAGVLQVGSATAGPIAFTSDIVAPTTWNTLALISGEEVRDSTNNSITVNNLALRCRSALLTDRVRVGTVAASVSDRFNLHSDSSLIIGTVDGISGVATTAGGGILLFVNGLDVQLPINGGTGLVRIAPFDSTALRASLGTEVSGQLSLTDTELGRVTAGVVEVGIGFGINSIAVNGAITRHAGYNTLRLTTSGSVTQTAPLSVANLAVDADRDVTLTNSANDVDTLAIRVFDINGAGLSYTDANSLTVGTVAGFVGITTNDGPVTLASGPGTSIINSLSTGLGLVTLAGGTFNLAGDDAIASAGVEVAGATLDLGSFNQLLKGLILTSGSVIGTGAIAAEGFEVRSGSVTARLRGPGSLTKATAGTVTLSGDNHITGRTTIEGGTLLINGTLTGAAMVTVNSGGTLGGTGTIAAPVAVNSGGTLAPGISPGILNTESLQFASGATLAVELNSPYTTAGADYDRVNVTGRVDLNSATLSPLGGAIAPPAGTVLTIINNDGTDAVVGTFAGLPQGSLVTVGSFTAIISYVGGTGNDVTLTAGNGADLSIVTTGPSTVVAGTQIRYTITVTNNGPGTAQDVVLRDPVPSGANASSFFQTSGPTFAISVAPGGVFTATAASLAAGASATFTLVLGIRPSATGAFSNMATVDSSTDIAAGNNTSTSTATITTSADLRVIKTGPATVAAGSEISYAITVTNAGPSDAQNVSLTDAVPANATFVSQSQSSGFAFIGSNPPVGATGTTTLTIATLAAGDSATFTIVDQVNAGLPGGATVTNTAAVTSTTSDPAAGNNSSTVISTVPSSPPTITRQPANQTVGEGNPVTFTASASGTPTPTVQWQFSTNGGLTFNGVTGATSTSLTFNAALSQNGSFFRAVFTNSVGSVTSNAATLTVVARPTAFALALDVPRDTARPLTLAGSDPAGRPLTFTVTSPPQHGTLSGTAPNLTYAPVAGYVGPDSLQYKVNNGFADSNNASVSINVFVPGSVQVRSVTIDDGTTQRSMVRSLTVAFSGVVSFVGPAANAFRLGQAGGGTVTLAVDLTGSTASQTVARLTFLGALTEGANSLVDGNYTLTVFGSQVQGGLTGGDDVRTLHRLFGDFNGDKAVNGTDLTEFRKAFGTVAADAAFVPYLDFNGDGAINGTDLVRFRDRFGVILP